MKTLLLVIRNLTISRLGLDEFDSKILTVMKQRRMISLYDKKFKSKFYLNIFSSSLGIASNTLLDPSWFGMHSAS